MFAKKRHYFDSRMMKLDWSSSPQESHGKLLIYKLNDDDVTNNISYDDIATNNVKISIQNSEINHSFSPSPPRFFFLETVFNSKEERRQKVMEEMDKTFDLEDFTFLRDKFNEKIVLLDAQKRPHCAETVSYTHLTLPTTPYV